jgi:hypothetical protein
MSVLFNPGAKPTLTMPLLGVCTRAELREVIASADTPVALRATALELMERRPPLRDTQADAPLQ